MVADVGRHVVLHDLVCMGVGTSVAYDVDVWWRTREHDRECCWVSMFRVRLRLRFRLCLRARTMIAFGVDVSSATEVGS